MIRLTYLDYRATMKERKTWLAAAMLLYAVLAIPVVLEKPPEHVREAISAWFGNPDPFVVFMFIWVDLAMNKSIGFLPVILGSAILLRERDTGVLAILGAKPISMSRYFVVRTISACAAMFTLYMGAQVLGAVYFSFKIQGFRPSVFLAAMGLHSFGGIWATALTAAIAVAVQRRVASALVSIAVLGVLVGMALVGYYQPAWQSFTMVNPISIATMAMGHLGDLSFFALFKPGAVLVVLTIITILVGARLAQNVEA